MHHPMHCLPHVEYTVFNVSKQWQNLSFNHTYKSTAFPGLGKSSIPWCSSRKYPYLPQGRDFFLNPPSPYPSGNSNKASLLGLTEPLTPQEIPFPSVGGSIDTFWICTLSWTSRFSFWAGNYSFLLARWGRVQASHL